MMEQIITINGMKCEGCTEIVKEHLATIPGVTSVTVSLKEKEAIIESSRAISTNEIEQALAETKFTLA